MELCEELGTDARFAVEIVGILCDEEMEFAHVLKIDERQVRWVGFDLVRLDAPLGRREASIAPRPYPVRAAKIRDAGLGADACTREGNNMLALEEPLGDRRDVLFRVLLVSHDACLGLFLFLSKMPPN
jgi:hypothetical protein